MAKRTKTCAVCGTVYEYCNTCLEDSYKPVWMNMFCSKDCLDAFETLSTYANRGVSKEDAKTLLQAYPEDKAKNLKKSIAVTYAEIMSEDKEETKEPIKVTTDEIKQDMAEQTVKEIVSDIKSESKKFYPKAVAHKKGR